MKDVTHHLCIFRQEEHFSASIDPTMFTVSTLIEYARNTVPLRYFFGLASPFGGVKLADPPSPLIV